MDEPLSTHYSLRVGAEQLKRWQQAAADTGRDLPEFIRQAAESEVEYSKQVAALRRLRRRRAERRAKR